MSLSSCSPAETALLKQLQNCFKVVIEQRVILSQTITDMLQNIDSLANLVEQLVCCCKVDFKTTPFCKFEGFSERLQYKIMASMEEKLAVLRTAVYVSCKMLSLICK